MQDNQYSTMVEASQQLAERGYTTRLSLQEGTGQLISEDSQRAYGPAELRIVEHHRFEGDTNPSDMAVIYAIEGPDGLKGTLLDAYGASASAELGEIIRQIPEND